jgi:hypothetical protein
MTDSKETSADSAPARDASTVCVRPANDEQFAVCGANLPAPGCWSLHDSEGEARVAAEALAAGMGVGVETASGAVVFL